MHSIRRGQRRRRNNERRGGKRVRRRRPPIREHVVAAHVINERAFWDTTAATTGMAPPSHCRIFSSSRSLFEKDKRIKFKVGRAHRTGRIANWMWDGRGITQRVHEFTTGRRCALNAQRGGREGRRKGHTQGSVAVWCSVLCTPHADEMR